MPAPARLFSLSPRAPRRSAPSSTSAASRCTHHWQRARPGRPRTGFTHSGPLMRRATGGLPRPQVSGLRLRLRQHTRARRLNRPRTRAPLPRRPAPPVCLPTFCRRPPDSYPATGPLPRTISLTILRWARPRLARTRACSAAAMLPAAAPPFSFSTRPPKQFAPSRALAAPAGGTQHWKTGRLGRRPTGCTP